MQRSRAAPAELGAGSARDLQLQHLRHLTKTRSPGASWRANSCMTGLWAGHVQPPLISQPAKSNYGAPWAQPRKTPPQGPPLFHTAACESCRARRSTPAPKTPMLASGTGSPLPAPAPLSISTTHTPIPVLVRHRHVVHGPLGGEQARLRANPRQLCRSTDVQCAEDWSTTIKLNRACVGEDMYTSRRSERLKQLLEITGRAPLSGAKAAAKQ